jgi:hypothetical protein
MLFLAQSQVQPAFMARPVVLASAPNIKSVLTKDIVEATRALDDKLVKLSSGNYGKYTNGAYVIVHKNCPVIANLRVRFQLTDKILRLASDGRFHYGLFTAKGSEFTSDEARVLALLASDAFGFDIDGSQVLGKSRLAFYVRPQVVMTNGNERFNYYPGIKFRDEEDVQKYESKKIIASNLKEMDPSRRLREKQEMAEGRFPAGEATDAGYTIKIFNLNATRNSLALYGSSVAKSVADLYEMLKEEYSKELFKTSEATRKQSPQVFGPLETSGLSDQDADTIKRSIEKSLVGEGFTQQAVNKKLGTLSFMSKDIAVDFQSGLHLVGQEPSKFSIAVRIWP